VNFKKALTGSVFLVLTTILSYGQASQTIKSGNWDDPTVWSNGVPNSTFGAITVRHTVHVTSTAYPSGSPLIIDQTTVGANAFSGYLIIDVNAFVQVNNGAGSDLIFTGTPTIGKVDVSGKLTVSTGVAFSGNTATNFNYLSNSFYEHQYTSASTALPTATYSATSTIILTGFTTGTFTAAWNVPVGNVIYNCTNQVAGTVNFAGFLRNIQGNLDILSTGTTGRIFFNNTGTSTAAAASAIAIGGHLAVSGSSAVLLTSTGTVEVTAQGSFSFASTSATASASASTGKGTLQVNGNTSMTSGTWNFSSGTNGNGIFNLLGDLATTGSTLTETGGGTSQGNLNFNGISGQQSFDPSGIAATTINVAVNNSSGALVSANLVLAGTLTLTSGIFQLPGTQLTLNGPVAQTSGSIGTTGTPTLIIGGTGTLPANLTIVNGSTFNTIQMNRSATAFITGSNFTVTTLQLYAGTFTNNGTVTMANLGLVDLKATTAAATGVLSHPLAAAGSYNILYTNNVALTTGQEIPASALALNNFTKTGTNTLTLGGNVTINGDLTVSTGTLTDGGNNRTIALAGNFTSSGTASTFSSSTFTFATHPSATSFSGAIAPTFGTLNFSSSVNISSSFRVNGNLSVSSGATVTASAGTATFGGTTTITNSGTLGLSAVTILTGSTLTAPATTLGIGGNFTVTGTFTNGGGTILFNGTSTLLGAGAKTFSNVSVNPSSTLSGAVALTIGGNLINNGTISFTAGTLTCNGSGKTWTGSPTSTTFFTTTISPGASITSSIAFKTNGLLTVTGSLISNGGFMANAALTIPANGSLTANTVPFSVAGVLTITSPGALSATAGADATYMANVVVSGTLTSSAQTTFGGTTILNGAGAKTFKDVFVTGSLTPNGIYSVLGNYSLSGTGVLNAGTSTTTFAGTSSIFSNGGSGTATFNNLTISAGKGLTANSLFKVNGALTITGALVTNSGFTNLGAFTVSATGSFVANTSPFSIAGVLTVTTPGTFAANSGANATLSGNVSASGSITSSALVTFAGTTTMTGAGAISLNAIVITGSLTPNTAYTMTGNLAVSGTGTLAAGNSTTTFNGATIFSNSGSGTVTFNNITIGAAKSFIANSNFTITGATLTFNTGSFLSTATTVFARAGTATLTSTGATSFKAVTINVGTTLTPNAPYTITGNLVINGILTAGTNTATFGGTTAITTTGTPTISFNNFQVSGSLTAFSGIMTINGNFVNNGTFAANAGTITFAGATAKTVSGSSVTVFNNINLTNGAAATDLSIESNHSLAGKLTIAANAHMDADGSANTSIFTFLSSGDSPTVDASLAIMPASALLQGSITVQRYMAKEGPGLRIYRYISSPVTNAPASDLQNEIPVTGTFAGSSACSGCGTTSSMFRYDETVLTGGVNGGYKQFPVASNTEILVPGRGYATFVRGNINPVAGSASARFDLRGPVNTGAINYGVTFTSSGVAANDGWNLVGNPYPSTIDWNSASGWTKTRVGATIYLLDNGTNPSQYATWNGSVGTNGGSRYIASGQGFFIQTTLAAPTLTSNENVKVPGTQTTFVREGEPQNVLRITLSQGNVRDESVIHFRDSATTSFDAAFDAVKLKNLKDDNSSTPFLNLSTISSADNKQLAINSLPSLTCSSTVSLDVSDVPQGSYQLDFSSLESFTDDAIIMLTDNFVTPSLTIDARVQSSYPFAVTANAASFGSGRFQLSFSYPALANNLDVSAAQVCSGKDASITLQQSQPGVLYFLKMNGNQIDLPVSGNGSALNLQIPGDSLSAGLNRFVVFSQSAHCSGTVYSQKDSIQVLKLNSVQSVSSSDVCQTGPATLKASGAAFGSYYHWYADSLDTHPLAGDSSEIFTTASLRKTKTFYVAIANALGCEDKRVPVIASVTHYDSAVIQQIDEKLLQSNFKSGNHWYLDGTLLPDTTSTLRLRSSGTYTLSVTVGKCTTSTDRVAVITGLEDSNEFSVKGYPNPTSGMFSIEIPDAQNEVANTLPVFNTLGDQIATMPLRQDKNKKKGQFDFGSYAPGLYYLKIVGGNTVRVVKVLKN
jgi:Ig-like domain CHU_C associated/Secretion system C-terminal sorting domain